MTWQGLRRLPARVRLARQLLLEYEVEQGPMSFDEAQAALVHFTEAIYSGRWTLADRKVGASEWRDATLAKAPHYAEGSD